MTTPDAESALVLVLAAALHDVDETCNAAYYGTPLADCAYRVYDIEQAEKLVVALRKAGWRIAEDPAATAPLFWGPPAL